MFQSMTIFLNYKAANFDLEAALADALGIAAERVVCVVSPAKDYIPFCADWRVVNSCSDAVFYVDGELLLLDLV